MLHVTLLAIALLGQTTIYTWTDKDGEEHFTDDPSSIPKGVKAKTMAEGEVETITTGPASEPVRPAAAADGGVTAKAPKPKPEVDTCERGRKRVAQAEAAVADAQKAAASPPPNRCQEVLNLHGHTAYAQCMASRGGEAAAGRRVATAQRELDAAKDELRRAQAAGCR